YERVIVEWRREQVSKQKKPASAHGTYVTIADLIARFLVHAESYYRHPDGTIGSEVFSYARALRPLARLYGHSLARDFGPLALKAIRQTLMEKELSRGFINQSVNRIRHVFKWGESEELLPSSTYHSLQTVAGLRYGQARESKGVLPVPEDVLTRTLPHLFPVV